MPGHARWIAFLGLVASLAAGRAAGSPVPLYPLAEVRPGLRGVALTVLEGTEPDSFAIEIVGVVERTEPGSHLILVRGLEEPLLHIGIAAGMSGSPIYVDGRLVGALAFSFVGATEPMGGATPIEEMLGKLGETFTASPPLEPKASLSGPGLEVPAYPVWRDQWLEELSAGKPLVPEASSLDLPAGLEPIGLPLFLGGNLAADAADGAGVWQGLGLRPAAGKAAGGQGSGLAFGASMAAAQSLSGAGEPASGVARGTGAPLKPGDAFGITLIGGDMVAAAIGTVTWIDGDRLIGLGHPFFEVSPIEMPLSRAQIHAIVPTRGVSFKVGSPLEEVGLLMGDRRSGIAALLGQRARRIPLSVTLRKDGEETERSFSFEVARNEFFTPALLTIALQAVLSGEIHGLGQATLASDLEVELEDGRTLRRRDLFETLGPGQTAGSVVAPVAYLAATGLAPFNVRSVSVRVESHPEVRTARVEEIQVPWGRVRPGGEVPVDIVLRHLYGRREVRRVILQVPETVRGDRVRVMVGCADAFFEWDQERAPMKYVPQDFDDLLRLLREYPSDENLIVRMYGASRGVVHQGREFASLPLSKWHALQGETSGGRTSAVGGLILDEEMIPTGEVIQGGQAVDLEILR